MQLTRLTQAITRRCSGLTLLEVVMTLAVLAVLGAIALPGVGAQMERGRLRHAAQTLLGDISEARYQAAQRRESLFITARDREPWCWAVSTAAGCDCGSKQACTVHIVNAADHPGIKLLQPLDLRFSPAGTPDAPASVMGTTLESPSGDRLRVEVSPQGRPRICAAAGRWPQIPACQ